MAQEKYVAYVGTYTHENSIGIHVYDIDMEKGRLTERGVAPISNPSNIVVAHSGKYLYSIEDEGVASFSIDENGDLTKINQAWIGGMRACHVEIDSKDRYLFLAGFHDGKVTMMRLNEDGSIAGIADGIFHQGIGKSSVEKRMDPRVACTKLTPDEKYLCAVDWGLNQIKIYEIDYADGKLHLYDILRCPFSSAPRRICFSKDGKYAYVLEEATNIVEIYTYELHNGKPVFEKVADTSVQKKEDPLASGAAMEFSPDGKYLYVSLDGSNEVVCLAVGEDGQLSIECNAKISGDYPKGIAILPDNKTLVSLNHDSNEIRTFTIDHEKKCVLMKNPPLKVDKPNSIVIHKLV
ncbi:MAG: beta-propeller fold lactonase family protein [Lachnospiraceae bacterium]|nr:beta-propeller fold lactonase family protein [Lachnospiraceae bacterium]